MGVRSRGIRAVAGWAVLAVAGCGAIDRTIVNPVDVAKTPPGFFVTRGDIARELYEPVAVLHGERRGVYWIGMVPVLRSRISDAIEKGLVREAQKLGADGLIQIETSHQLLPPFPYSIVTLGFMARIVHVDALAVKMKRPAGGQGQASGPAASVTVTP